MPLPPGTRLGPYEIVAPLGAGGMGEVYRARDMRLGREVAVKVLPQHLTASPEDRARFKREAKTISSLNHPHICVLHDVGQEGETDFLVMELVDGETLAQRIARGALPSAEVLRLGAQVADALDRAHRAGVIHRDLKPGNVMLTKSGAKLMDFGLARSAGRPAHGADDVTATAHEKPLASVEPITKEGSIVGTIPYMAPEQLEGGRTDARSDIWALGCVLYEMATGGRAFQAPTMASLILAIMRDQPREISDLAPTTPPELERAVMQCLSKDPDDRWQSAGDLRRELSWIGQTGHTTPRPHRPAPARRAWRLALYGGGAVVLVAAALLLPGPNRRAPAPTKPMHTRSEIAVLPFQNLSADGPHVYFAGGLHDELLTQLAKVASLKVISRTSVMGYQGAPKPVKAIASELGVGCVVEGSVQVIDGRLRVSVQLIDAMTDEHLWAERYDRTLDDAFAIQSDIAQQIVAAVGAAVTSVEQERLAAEPSANPQAYRLYLQGREYHRRGYRLQDMQAAQQLYERALGLDPSLALAHAALSDMHGDMYFGGWDPSPARATRMREEAETALRIAPGLPEAHIAMGLAHLRDQRDYRRASDEFSIALRGLPNDAKLWGYIAAVHRRLGKWDQVFAAFERAAQLDPRFAQMFSDRGGDSYLFTRRYADAIGAFDRALSLAPDLHVAAINRGWAYFHWKGHLDTLRAALGRIPSNADVFLGSGVTEAQVDLLLMERKADTLLHVLRAAGKGGFGIYERYAPSALYAARGHTLRGDHAAARAAFASALARLDSTRKVFPDDWQVHAARGVALAGLGRRDEARGEASWLQRSIIYRQDAYEGPSLAQARAEIFAEVGDAEEALDEIERLLAEPSWLSVHMLRLDPRWDSIRGHPRFVALLAKYGSGRAG